MTSDSKDLIPRHQWTNGGDEVLLLRYVGKDGESFGGFKWPLTVGSGVEAPDWNTRVECGGGLHGWPWGFSIGEGKEPDCAAPRLALAMAATGS